LGAPYSVFVMASHLREHFSHTNAYRFSLLSSIAI